MTRSPYATVDLSEPPRPAPTSRTSWFHVFSAALVVTALNAAKPPHMDDSQYLHYAAEFIAHPLNPYGFEYGTPNVEPANDILNPPVFCYWLGAGTLLVGDDPFFLKLWLIPFPLALAWAVAFLAARFCPTLSAPLVWLCLLSPAVLPGFNFMLDLPMLALGLTALALAMLSVERDAWALAVLAGVVGGVALQLKYTAIVPCAAMIAWCALRRRPVRGLAAAALAVTLAVGWECLLLVVQGESHFMAQLRIRQNGFVKRCLHLLLPLISQVAGLAPAVALLALMALGLTRRRVVAVGLVLVGGLGVLAVVPSDMPLLVAGNGKPLLTPSNIVYGMLAVPVWGALGAVCLRLARPSGEGGGPADGSDRVSDWFLLAWVVLELGAFFALSPFPAARRVAPLLLVLTLAAGRLAYRQGVTPRAAAAVAGFGAAMGLFFFSIDLMDARAARTAAGDVVRSGLAPAQGGTFWYVSWWGFSYQAERAGLLALRLNRQAPRPGDLLAVFDIGALEAALAQHPELGRELIHTVVVADRFPLKVTLGYYGGRTPLEHQQDGRARVRIYRITESPNAANATPELANDKPVGD